MPLVNNSIATDLRALAQLDLGPGADPTIQPSGTIGVTSEPVGSQAPQWTINVTQTTGDQLRYFGSLVVNSVSQPGTNASHYLAAGIYETNLAVDMTEYVQGQDVRQFARPFEGYDNDRIYYYLTGPIATSNHDAEVEHCNDHQYAYQHSLVALDNALAAVAGRGKFGPFTTAEAATARVTSEIGLALPQPLRGIAMNQGAWVAEYLRLCGRSKQRDDLGYHEFGMQLLAAAPVGNITYLTGANRDGGGVTRRFVQLTNGGTQINQHPSATLIA